MGLATPPGTLMFPTLFVAKPRVRGNPQSDLVFQANLVFDENAQKTPAYLELKKAVMAAITDKFGDAKAKDQRFIASLQLPIKDAGDKDYEGYGPGKTYINPWTKQKPGVVDKMRQDILDPADVFAGQLARFYVQPFAWENSGKRGVSFSLEHVQILDADRPRLDGRRSAKDAFDDDLSTEGAGSPDDDIPF